MLGRVDVHRIHALQDLAGGGIDVADRLHLVAEQLDPHQPIFVGGADLQHISLHPETAAGDFGVVAAVLVVHQLPQLAADVEGLAHLELHRRLEVFTRNPQAVNAADRGHHDHVAPFKQRARRRVTQHVDLLVDRRRLGDVGVADRYVGLRLVIVVIGDEVLNGVLREELPQLVAELGRQGFVVGQHQRRPAGLGDHVGHRERLARARGPQQRLITLAAVYPRHQLLDRRRLITLRRIRSREVVGGHGCGARRRPSIIAGEQDEVLRLPNP